MIEKITNEEVLTQSKAGVVFLLGNKINELIEAVNNLTYNLPEKANILNKLLKNIDKNQKEDTFKAKIELEDLKE